MIWSIFVPILGVFRLDPSVIVQRSCSAAVEWQLNEIRTAVVWLIISRIGRFGQSVQRQWLIRYIRRLVHGTRVVAY